MNALKPTFDTCDTNFDNTGKAVESSCTKDSITWKKYGDNKCEGDTTDTTVEKEKTCFAWGENYYKCDLPNVKPGPTPPIPGRDIPSNNSSDNKSDDNSNSAFAVGVTMAVATVGVAATLF